MGGLSWFYPPPEGTESALRVMLANIVASARAWHASLDTNDPDLIGANKLKERYVRWQSAFENIVNSQHAPVPPELYELQDEVAAILDEPGVRGTTELDGLEATITYKLEQWSGEDADEAISE